MTCRQDTPLWACRSSRNLVNEPKEVLLAGTKGGRNLRDAKVAMKKLGDKYNDLANLQAFEDAVTWADQAQAQKIYTHQTAHSLAHLRAYTVNNPKYFEKCNECFYQGADMEPWEDFIDGVCVGIDREIETQSPPPELHRVAWIPKDIFDAYFAEGNEVHFKGFVSASSGIQWSFLNHQPLLSKDKIPVIFSWDKESARDAGHIQAYSVCEREDEYVFKPYWRGDVQRKAEQMSPSGMKVTQVFLSRILRIPMLQKVLDAKTTSDIAVLSAALMVSLHCKDGDTYLGAISQCIFSLETAIRRAAIPREPEAVKAVYNGIWKTGFRTAQIFEQRGDYVRFAWLGLWALPGMTGVVHRMAGTIGSFDLPAMDKAVEDERARVANLRSEASGSVIDHVKNIGEERVVESLKNVQEVPFDKMLRQIKQDFHRYRETVAKHMDEKYSDEEKAAGDKEAVEVAVKARLAREQECEEENLLCWARMITELVMICSIIDGLQQNAFQSDFPLQEHPLHVALAVGDVVFQEGEKDDDEDQDDEVPRRVKCGSGMCTIEYRIEADVLEKWVAGERKKFKDNSGVVQRLWWNENGEVLDQDEFAFDRDVKFQHRMERETLYKLVQMADKVQIPHNIPRKVAIIDELASAAARKAVALIVHLRYMLSRTRILVVIGEPDAGKTTLLNEVFGLDLSAGVENKGRTKTVSFHAHPRYSDLLPVLVADAPGIGDKVPARNDLIRLMMTIAATEGIMEMMRVLLVRKSGRSLEASRIEELEKLAGKDRIMHVVTQVDKRYKEFLEPKQKELKKEGKKLKEEKAVRKELADQIVSEDCANVGTDVSYVCLQGPASKVFEEEETSDSDSDDDIGALKKWMVEDMQDFFGPRALSRKQLRHRLDRYLDLPEPTI